MATSDMQPLATVVEKIWGVPDHTQRYSRAYFNWVHALYMIDPRQPGFNETRAQDFISSASQAQRSSLQLLREWWEGGIQERKLSTDFQNNILIAAMAPLMDHVDLGDERADLRETYQRIAQQDSLPFDPKLEESSYHQALWELWQGEFAIIPGLGDFGLPATRYWAAIAATNQRIAWSCFETLPLDGVTTFQTATSRKRRPVTNPVRTPLSVCPWIPSERSPPTRDDFPYYVWDISTQKTVEVSSLPGLPRYTVISHTWGRWKVRPESLVSIAGVDWLVPENTIFDIQKLPRELTESTSFTMRFVWLDLLCIPQHCKYSTVQKIKDQEVDKQGKIFQNAAAAVVWLSSIDDWQGLEIAVLWFSAKYLHDSRSQRESNERNSREQAVLANWLQDLEIQANEVNTGLLENYTYSGRESFQSADLCGWFTSLWALQEVCLRPDMLLLNRNWTEFVVGPRDLRVTFDNLLAMVAASEQHAYRTDTAVFSVEDMQSFPSECIEVPDGSADEDSALRRLLQRIDHLPGNEAMRLPNMPRAAGELHYILNRLEMTQLLDPKPLTILALGNQRYCEKNRAVAIMSVIGATEWHEKLAVDKNNGSRLGVDKTLVLGTFPLAFVQEVRKRLGIDFFRSTGSGLEACRSDVFIARRDGWGKKITPVGSMMPFSSRNRRDPVENSMATWTASDRPTQPLAERLRNDKPQPRAAAVNAYSALAIEHSSVEDWSIMPDGTVKISQAAVFASHVSGSRPRDSGARLRARVIAHSCAEGTTAQDVFLEDYLGSEDPKLCKYAVLMTSGSFSRCFSGIIVQEVLQTPAPPDIVEDLVEFHAPTKLLVRIGMWTLWDLSTMTDKDVPRVEMVNWRVL